MIAPQASDPGTLSSHGTVPSGRCQRTVAALSAMAVLACARQENVPADSVDLATVARARVVFEVGLWPGEGIPVVEALRAELPLLQSPEVGSPVVSVLMAGSGRQITYDSTRFQTITPAAVRVIGDAVVRGRHLGALRHLSREQYNSTAFRDTAIALAPPAVFEFLQYRAEGTCFVRIGGRVVDADPCPVHDRTRFTTAGEPQTLWWIHAHGATGAGWLQVTDSTAAVEGRRF